MSSNEIFGQRDWTDDALRAAGFRYFVPKKRLVMARILPETEAPLTIVLAGERETVAVQAGYVICFDPGSAPRRSLYEYEHWPVQPEIFAQTYRPWDKPGWKPNPAEKHLMALGCSPHYKVTGIWAKKLTEPTWMQSVESAEPVLLQPGAWLAVGSSGAPYHLTNRSMRARYVPAGDNKKDEA